MTIVQLQFMVPYILNLYGTKGDNLVKMIFKKLKITFFKLTNSRYIKHKSIYLFWLY